MPQAGFGSAVTIQVVGPVAGVDVALAELLEPLLTVERRVFTNNGGRVATHMMRQGLFHVANERFWFPAGAVPRITAWLRAHGHKVQIEDRTPPRQGVAVDPMVLKQLPDDYADFVRAIVANRRGLIEVSRPRVRVALIAAAAGALPEARINVATVSRSLARDVHWQLRRHLREPVALLNKGGGVLSETRLKVCTWAGVDEHSCDVIFFSEATDAITAWYVGERRRDEDERNAEFHARLQARLRGEPITLPSTHPAGPMEITNQHVFGFVAEGQRLGRRERLLLEAQVGTVINRVTGPAGPLADVQVLFAEVPLVPIEVNANSLDRKRQAVWHNERRNEVISQIADALARRKPEALWRHGLLLDGDHLELGAGTRQLRVAILVESPEHGRELARRLTEWPLLVGQRSYEDRDDRLPTQSIITLVNADGLARRHIDVLVRADGTSGPLDLPGFPPRARGRQGRPVVLVDFGDEDDAIAVAATRRRLQDYQARGWEVTAPDRWLREPDPEPDRRQAKSGRGAKGQGN
jgi:hypothetical protein